MAYGTEMGVRARIPGLGVSAVSTPDSSQISTWLEQGSALVDRVLSGGGYAVPVPGDATVYAELTALAEQYAAAHALRARGLDTLTGEGEARSDVWLREVMTTLREMANSDLTGLGVSQARVEGVRRQRIRTTQLRRIDGYSATYETATRAYTYPSE